MEPRNKRTRRYRSETRTRQAAETREAILAAAQRLLERRGYAAMTFARIARDAGVATPTVYAVFGNKGRLLQALVEQVKGRIGLGQAFDEMLGASDPGTKFRLAARITRAYSEQGGALLDALRTAGASQPVLARVWKQFEDMRLRGQTKLIEQMADAGRLRRGLAAAKAADLFWMLSAHDTWRLLVRDRGWSGDEFENWLADTLAILLLQNGRARRG